MSFIIKSFRSMSNTDSRLAQVKQRISDAEKKWNRKPASVALLAVSKTRRADELEKVIAQGQCEFGENYLQEALDKIAALKHHNHLIWHFIGSIQSNKSRPIAEHFDWVHSIDRLKIASRLSQQRPVNKAPLNILLQVNISHEASKSGINEDSLLSLASDIDQLPGLCLRGIMGLPAPATSFEAQRQQCDQLLDLYLQLQNKFSSIDTLSMGTSNDFEAAIASGSTMVRIGTAIFGERQKPASARP